MSVEVALMVEGQEGVGWQDWLAVAAAAEKHGFAALYRSDHYLSERPASKRGSLDAWGTICGLAARTSTIRLGTLVSPVTFRHPSTLAKLALTADHISGGRIDVGMGMGWYREEHDAYGFEFPVRRERMSMLEEQVEIVRRTWRDEPFSFDGSYYRLTHVDARPKPTSPIGPRLIIGGSGGPRSVRVAARWADEYNSLDASEDGLRELRAQLDAACVEVGREPATLTLSTLIGAVAGRSSEELESRVAAALRFTQDDSGPNPLDRVPEGWLVGTPEDVAAGVRRLAHAGAGRVVLWPPRHDDLELVELLGREVLPQLGRVAA
jgi:F420-dependent oxidoreductase-like protein